MLEHLVQFSPDDTGLEDFMAIDAVNTADLLSAQIATAQWLEELGATPDDTVNTENQAHLARDAFKMIVSDQDTTNKKPNCFNLKPQKLCATLQAC